MSYGISPTCPAPDKNSPTTNFCMSCEAKILLKDRYRVLKLLGQGGFGKTFKEYLGRVLDRMIAISLPKRYRAAAVVLKSLKNSTPVIIIDRASTLHQSTTVSEEVWKEFNSPLTYEILFQVSNLTSWPTSLGYAAV
jgi:hypothetical protein